MVLVSNCGGRRQRAAGHITTRRGFGLHAARPVTVQYSELPPGPAMKRRLMVATEEPIDALRCMSILPSAGMLTNGTVHESTEAAGAGPTSISAHRGEDVTETSSICGPPEAKPHAPVIRRCGTWSCPTFVPFPYVSETRQYRATTTAYLLAGDCTINDT